MAGGVILFTRNFSSLNQLKELTAEIHSLKSPSLLIAVDHEGGKVQRFKNGFTQLPAMRELGKIWDESPIKASRLAQLTGYVIAAELRDGGVDFSFTPVLDIDYGRSNIIGSRAFHRKPEVIWKLAYSLMQGLKFGGMEAVGKHFPGHGYIREDSHIAIPIDKRSYKDIEMNDLIPFQKMISYGITGIMPAHVIYPKIDSQPAGFSGVWLQEVLRTYLRFDGCIFSDDLSMEGARVAGNIVDRAETAFKAGCDMVLVCNDPYATDKLLSELKWNMSIESQTRLDCMRAKTNIESAGKLHENIRFIEAVHEVKNIGIST
tara:strand:- start:32708 stop:33661 length:954 start_codon:yes stop_codon:yes gene_type:complete